MIARLHGDQLERYRPKLRAVEVPPPNQVKTPPYPRTKTETFAAFAQPRPSRSNLGLPAWRLLVSAVWAGVFAATVYLANPVMPQYWWQSFTAGEGITAPNSWRPNYLEQMVAELADQIGSDQVNSVTVNEETISLAAAVSAGSTQMDTWEVTAGRVKNTGPVNSTGWLRMSSFPSPK